MDVKFTTPKKELEALVLECRYARETAESVVLPLLRGLVAVTLRHAAAKGFTDSGTHEKPVFRRGSKRKKRPGGWSSPGSPQDPPSAPGTEIGWSYVVDGPRNAKGQWTYEKRVRWQSSTSKLVARSGRYRAALLEAARELESGAATIMDAASYRRRSDGTETDNAYLSVQVVTRSGNSVGVMLELEGVWAALEAGTKYAPRGRHIIGQRMRNNRRALTKVLQEAGNPWGLGGKRPTPRPAFGDGGPYTRPGGAA